jgi:hypothetical protein
MTIKGRGPLDLGDLRGIARHDPRLAVALLGGCDNLSVIRPDLLGLGVPSCGDNGWQILNVFGTFVEPQAGQTIPLQQNGIMESDLWVREVTYTVERPNAFASSVLKAQSDYYNSLQPSMNFTLIVKGLCQYVISPDPTPLQSVSQSFECACPVGMVVGCNTTMSGTLNNRRAFDAAIGEIPTEVTLTFHSIRLPTRYDACNIGTALAALRSVKLLDA